MQKLLSLDETCGILKVKKGTLYQWVHQKKIPYVKIGGKVAFIEEQIDNFIKTNIHAQGIWTN